MNTNANPFMAAPLLDPRTNLRGGAHLALVEMVDERKAENERRAVALRELGKARAILRDRKPALRFLGKVAVIQFAAAGVIALFSRGGAA